MGGEDVTLTPLPLLYPSPHLSLSLSSIPEGSSATNDGPCPPKSRLIVLGLLIACVIKRWPDHKGMLHVGDTVPAFVLAGTIHLRQSVCAPRLASLGGKPGLIPRARICHMSRLIPESTHSLPLAETNAVIETLKSGQLHS